MSSAPFWNTCSHDEIEAMTLIADPWWLSAVLAAALLLDALASIKPPMFIQKCLEGVRFPRDWWWTLIVIKLAATTGLVVGFWIPGVGLATTCAVVVYFVAASCAHVRAHFLKQEFWVNCLGMLAIAVAALVFGYLV